MATSIVPPAANALALIGNTPLVRLAGPSAAFDPVTNQLVVAWRAPQPAATSSIQVATRPSP